MSKAQPVREPKRALSAAPEFTFSPPSLDLDALPPAVTRLRARILRTVAGGDIADLTIPLGWNEVPPLFMRGQPQRFDPVAFLQARSFDGRGAEMLRILGAVFRQPYAVETRGAIRSFVWPMFPVVPEREPLPGERLAPWRCVRFADLARRSPLDAPLIHRAAIGTDGTWHYFWTEI